jgi:hypothetical protein
MCTVFLVLLACTDGPEGPSAAGDSRDDPVDADGDGYEAPADCNDSNASVHPGAPEMCNDQDDDCDGVVDENPVDGVVVYPDLDGDSFGDVLAAGTPTCEITAGQSATHTDCDDDDDAVHPGAPEACDDGADNDCDTLVDEDCRSRPFGVLGLDDASVTYVGTTPDLVAGANVSPGVDADGPYIMIKSRGSAGTEFVQDKAWFLRTTAPSVVEIEAGAAGVIDLAGSPRFTYLVDASDDADGDGLDDAAFAPYGSEFVYVFLGPVSHERDLSAADGLIDLGDANAEYAAWAGDLDGDRRSEIIAGQPWYYTEWDYEYPSGRLMLFSGAVIGSSDAPPAMAVIEGVHMDSYGDRRTRGVGDLDGDGLDELCVNGYSLFYGPVEGALDERAADVDLSKQDRSDPYPFIMEPAGDLDGDGANDALLFWVYPDDLSWQDVGVVVFNHDIREARPIADAPIRFAYSGPERPADMSAPGTGLATGDFDGDGIRDVVIGGGNHYNDDGTIPAAWIEYGPFEGTRETGSGATIEATPEFNAAGWAGANAVIDLDSDGFDDILLGVDLPGYDPLGMAVLFLGGPAE